MQIFIRALIPGDGGDRAFRVSLSDGLEYEGRIAGGVGLGRRGTLSQIELSGEVDEPRRVVHPAQDLGRWGHGPCPAESIDVGEVVGDVEPTPLVGVVCVEIDVEASEPLRCRKRDGVEELERRNAIGEGIVQRAEGVVGVAIEE